jgi:hypothetical protein
MNGRISLEGCYSDLARLAGFRIEPIAVIQAVEQHRRFWRPPKPKLILLAESHVHTTEQELKATIRIPENSRTGMPLGFVRLVYCLGYGESVIVDGSAAIEGRNSGTPQFWQIFYSCIHRVTSNTDFGEIQVSRTQDFRKRINNKIKLLVELRERGIWLVDASIAALYGQGQPKPPHWLRDQVLQKSWDGYIRFVMQEACPEAVLCIGLGVARSLQSRLNQLGIPWDAVPQPQARLTSIERFEIFAAYLRASAYPGAVRDIRKRWLSRITE